MLWRFMYLEESTLDGYISALEGGLRLRTERTVSADKAGKAGFDARLVQASGSRGSSEEEMRELSDTANARFARLLELVVLYPDKAGWLELTHLSDLAEAGYGALVSAECEIHVPDAVRMLSGEGGAASTLDAAVGMLPMAEKMGLDTEGMPDSDEMQAMSQFLSRLSSDQVIVGEDAESDWKIAGRLASESIRDAELEGYVRLVGKVAQRWPENRWKPLMALPGASLLPRKERKALEAQQPADNDDEQYLQGPAVMLDTLAVYR